MYPILLIKTTKTMTQATHTYQNIDIQSYICDVKGKNCCFLLILFYSNLEPSKYFSKPAPHISYNESGHL